ncbi:MAG TPA: hypothetical protein VEJ63_13935, partial [Planctomycetota bacterium]|nr:hypothetical protein [Planctomycetota bacterium]
MRILLLISLFAVLGVSASGASKCLEAGQNWSLTEDFVLSGADALEIKGTKDKPCTVDGQFNRILTKDKWTGRIHATYCNFKNLGKKENVANDRLQKDCESFVLHGAGASAIVFENCSFEFVNTFVIANHEQSMTRFVNNTIAENAINPCSKAAHLSRGIFEASGTSKEKKVFQGNRVYRGGCSFSAPNWLIGGEKDAESNIIIGVRAGVFAGGEGTLVRGNYIECNLRVTEEYPYWSQVSTVGTSCTTEHNVIRRGHWVVRGISGEFRHNLVMEPHGHN